MVITISASEARAERPSLALGHREERRPGG